MHMLGYQKEVAVQQAECAGEIQISVLFEQLEKAGISPMVGVHCIYISTAYSSLEVAHGSSG